MVKLSPAQQEQLLNIGTYLKSVRQDQGKDIDEVANQIFIRPALVRAIEAADSKALPEPIFVQGFIRRYADYLRLDGQELSRQFESTPVSVLPDPNLADGRVEGVVSRQDRHALKVLSKAETIPSRSPQPEETNQGKWLLGLAAIALLLGGVLWVFTGRSPETAAPPPAAPEEPEVAAEPVPEPVAQVEPESESVAEGETGAAPEAPVVTENNAPINFEVSLEGDSWMRVIVDGEEVYEGILTTGTQQSWTAQNELTVRAGNSGAVLYSFNGTESLPLGEPGSVSRLTLTPDTDPQALAPQ